LLAELYPTAPWDELFASFPNRTEKAILLRAQTLGIERKVANWVGKTNVPDFSDFQKGYVAAAIDFEGSISLYKDKGYLYPGISFVNSDLTVLEYLRTLFRSNRKISVHARDSRKDNWKQTYTLRIESYADIERILKQVKDHLIIKRRQAELMLEFLEIRKCTPRQFEYKDGRVRRVAVGYSQRELEIYKELRKLNRRGEVKNGWNNW